jgi:hypothetical protein
MNGTTPGTASMSQNQTQAPRLVTLPSTRSQGIDELVRLLTRPARSFEEVISAIALDGGAALLSAPIRTLPVNKSELTAGFNYSMNAKMLAYVRVGLTTSNHWAVQSLILDGASSWITHYYSADGTFAGSEGSATRTFENIPAMTFETACPILNLLYTVASIEYPKTVEGTANTALLHTIERILKRVEMTRGTGLSFNLRSRDPAILRLNEKLLKLERDPVYTWKERQLIFSKIKEERKTLIATKKRAHRSRFVSYTLPLLASDLKNALHRFKVRPLSNLFGLVERILLDPVRWFLKVVRGNMGYSVALAIYSPFTFFFITQPMNPHAMWAVGKVRSAYIETTDKVKNLIGGAAVGAAAADAATSTPEPTEKKSETPAPASGSSTSANTPVSGMPLSSDRPEVATQSWEDRMSQFKAMQISYEGNLEIAPRFGRLEQMETQLNWPLIVESTWLETERYLQFLSFLKANEKDYDPAFIRFAEKEKSRAEEVQFYLWDRNIRFILDHPYTMMDDTGEQTQMDHYVGRSFILLRDMTTTLANRSKGLVLPQGHDRIMALAKKFDSEYKAGGSVLARLKNNSKLFESRNPMDTAELRNYMKRQWEVLYLLQNHAQEASNSGLQMYNWSVRNTVHLLQSLYSTKREELSMIALQFKKGLTRTKLTANGSFRQMDSQYEALFHMMVLEFTSIRKELAEHLKNDIEASQRKHLIDGLESFFQERDSLLKTANLI